MQAPRDENRATVGLAWDATNNTTKPLLVDPTTGRLEIDINNATPPATSDPPMKIDENNIWAALLTEDDATAALKPLLVDTNGYVLIDLVIE